MGKYVLDTGVFRKLLTNYPRGGIYKSHWEQIDAGLKNNELVSVDECYEELIRYYNEENEDRKWLKDRKKYFAYPTTNESIFIKELFKNKKYQEMIHFKNIISNAPSADPFVIAKAKCENATVVTIEERKPNSSRMPTVCDDIGIRCISYEDFMSEYIR